MASSSYILSHEADNSSRIHLHQDGIFLRAYDRSAYLFVEGIGCDYKLTKRYVKLVDHSLVSLGFPTSSLDQYLVDADFEYINSKHICISNASKSIDIAVYAAWHDSIALVESKQASKHTANLVGSDLGLMFMSTSLHL